MKVAIYGPIALWEYHHAATIEIAWREYRKGSKVGLILCRKTLGSCAANPNNIKRKCHDCINQNEFSIKRHFPESTQFYWVEPVKIMAEFMEKTSLIKNQSDLERFRVGDWDVGRGVLSELVSRYRSVVIPEEVVRTSGIDILRKAVSFYEGATRVLENNYDKLFVWGGRRAAESSVVAAAARLGMPITYYEIGSSLQRFNISNNELHTFFGIKSEIQGWKERSLLHGQKVSSYSEPEEFFERMRKGRGSDPHYRNFLDGYTKALPEKVLTSPKPILTVFTSSAWEFAMFRDYRDCAEDFRDTYKLLERIACDEKLKRDFMLVIRWHPNLINASESERALAKSICSKTPDVLHIEPNNKINSYDLVKASDIVVSTGSTIGLESAVMGKPSIVLGVCQYSGLGSVYEPRDYQAFLELLGTNPKPLPLEGAKLWAEWMGNFGEEFRFVQVRSEGYFLHNKRIRYRGIDSKFIEGWLKLKHLVKVRLFRYFRM